MTGLGPPLDDLLVLGYGTSYGLKCLLVFLILIAVLWNHVQQ